jgi:apolipoprotein N-acyltransferase
MVWLAAALLPCIFGMYNIKKHHANINQAKKLHCALIQPGLKMEEKTPFISYINDFIAPTLHWEKTFSFLPKKDRLDLIILPEAVFPFGAFGKFCTLEEAIDILQKGLGKQSLKNIPLQKPYAEISPEGIPVASNAFFAKSLANYFQADVIIGLDDSDQLTKKNYNAAFHFSPKNEIWNRYEKQILLPLAEYLPLSFFKKLAAKYGISEFFSHGHQAKVFAGVVPFSVSICYEDCFSHVIRKAKAMGAELLINLTNDAYYPNTELPRIHHELGKIRAVENGTSVLRCCNTGVTSYVNCLGKSLSFADEKNQHEWIQGAFITEVSTYHYKTLFSLIGNHFILGLCFIIIVFFFIEQIRKIFHSKEKSLRIN